MSADLALLANDPTSLDVFDDPGKQIELACQRANAWLKAGIDVRIETIVETKAQAAALAAFAIQKQLGHDAELAALEVQRRAERGTGLAIRRGQQTGEVAAAHETRRRPIHDAREPDIIPASPSDYFSNNQEKTESYAMTDGVSDDQFDEAIEEARAEGNLSRANVVRKVKGEKPTVAFNTRWAFEPDRRAATAKATAGFLAKFEKQVDPDGVLPADERAKRANNLMRAHMARIRARRRRPHSTTRT